MGCQEQYEGYNKVIFPYRGSPNDVLSNGSSLQVVSFLWHSKGSATGECKSSRSRIEQKLFACTQRGWPYFGFLSRHLPLVHPSHPLKAVRWRWRRRTLELIVANFSSITRRKAILFQFNSAVLATVQHLLPARGGAKLSYSWHV